jgi:hypothetical protein
MATTKSRTDLIERALRNLGALPQGTVPNAEESQSMDDLIEPVLASLSERNIVYVPDPDQIPEQWFEALGHCLAWAAASEFGAASDVALAAKCQKAELDLRIMQAQPPTYETLKTEFF